MRPRGLLESLQRRYHNYVKSGEGILGLRGVRAIASELGLDQRSQQEPKTGAYPPVAVDEEGMVVLAKETAVS